MDKSTRRDKTSEYLIKILSLGDSGVGKTTLLYRYTEGVFINECISTVGIDLIEKRFEFYDGTFEEEETSDNFENTAEISKNKVSRDNRLDDTFLFEQPHERQNFNAPKRRTCNGRKVHLQFWDTAGQEKYRSLTTAFYRDAMGFLLVFDLTQENSFVNIRHWLDKLEQNKGHDNPPTVLVGNKSDLVKIREINRESANKFAKSLGIRYFETSALTGDNIKEAVDVLIGLIIKDIDRQSKTVPVIRTSSTPTKRMNSQLSVLVSDLVKEVDGINAKSMTSCTC